VRHALVACALLGLLAVTATSCSVGTSTKGGSAQLVVTRDFGKQRLLSFTEDRIPSGETAMRMLMRSGDVKTRYGGRFVTAIKGVESRTSGTRKLDWFYYVNGIEADVGAAERKVASADRVWWDYHDWSAVMRVPAVVGSFPEPFLHGSEGKRFPIRIDCGQDDATACTAVSKRLEAADIAPSTSAIGAVAGKDLLRLVVGTWGEVRQDGASRLIEEGPDKSGVFAKFGPGAGGGYELDLLDSEARTVQSLGPGSGLVAATRFEDQQPTWVVTGTDSLGVQRAAALITERALRDRFAIATTGAAPIALPAEAQR
jgi:Domain of unknown function (DUF4430)